MNRDYEIEKLKKHIEELEQENGTLKISGPSFKSRSHVRYSFVKKHRDDLGPIKKPVIS